MKQLQLIGFGLLALLLGCNPFAPGLEEVDVNRNQTLGDRTQIDGFFEWWKNSYDLLDTAMYGLLIAQDFRFAFTDFENGSQVFWDRSEEMRATHNMFRQVQAAKLQWTNYVFTDTAGADTAATVERSFNLQIVRDQQNVFRGFGSARIKLRRPSPQDPWRMTFWEDKSNF